MFDNLVGQTLDRYVIIRRIGEDQLGTVFKAHDPSLQRDVALRVINPSIMQQPNFAENFLQAARIAARLDHPNIVQVFDSGEALSLRYIVMEYIPGANLEKLLRGLRQEGKWILLEEAIQLVRQLALALEYVRSQKVPQRTIKPANIKIKPVQSERLPYMPVLVGLGLGRLVERGLGDQEIVNPDYLSPEGSLGRTTDARSDVYSLGVLLFELVTGQLPFQIQSFEDAVRYHVRQPLPPPRSIRPDMPESLEQVILRSMEKNPEGRFSDPATLANELERITPEVAQVSTAPPVFESAVSLLVPYRRSVAESAAGAPDEERHAALVEGLVSPHTTMVTPVDPVEGHGQVDVVLDNSQLSVEPGSSVTVGVVLINRRSSEDFFTVTLEGVPPSWLPMTSQVIQLRPGERQDVRFTIQPPRSPHSRAGRYPLTVRGIHQQAPGRFAEAKGTLTVAAFSQFSSELYTPRLGAGETGQIAVNNLSNTPETFTLGFRDPERELVFQPPQAQLRLAEGQAGIAEFQATLRQPRWIGSERTHPFSAQVSSSTGETQTQSGEVVSTSVLPVWLLGLLALLFVCFAGAIALVLSGTGLQASRATATAIALQTAAVVDVQATMLAESATAQFLADANQATLQAVTETAIWQDFINQTMTAVAGLSATEQAFVTETSVALQTTQTAIAVQALETAQAQQAEQTAAALLVTQTAAALQATQAAAEGASLTQTAQAASEAATAQAATAIAATAQAGVVQTAAAQTAIAQASTQTAASGLRIAYVYLADTVVAGEYQAMLQGNGFQTDLVHMNQILATDFGPYRAILIGPGTGSGENWGDPQGAQANHLIAARKPILGLGDGGYAFFGRANLAIGFENGVAGEGTDIVVADRRHEEWSRPHQIAIPDNQILNLYSSATPFVAINMEIPPFDVREIGRRPDQAIQYLIIQQGDSFLLWGFARGPAAMTQVGQQVFVNVLTNLIPD